MLVCLLLKFYCTKLLPRQVKLKQTLDINRRSATERERANSRKSYFALLLHIVAFRFKLTFAKLHHLLFKIYLYISYIRCNNAYSPEGVLPQGRV